VSGNVVAPTTVTSRVTRDGWTIATGNSSIGGDEREHP
jgi:hypothetical protein